jgi:hypothetical protein
MCGWHACFPRPLTQVTQPLCCAVHVRLTRVLSTPMHSRSDATRTRSPQAQRESVGHHAEGVSAVQLRGALRCVLSRKHRHLVNMVRAMQSHLREHSCRQHGACLSYSNTERLPILLVQVCLRVVHEMRTLLSGLPRTCSERCYADCGTCNHVHPLSLTMRVDRQLLPAPANIACLLMRSPTHRT